MLEKILKRICPNKKDIYIEKYLKIKYRMKTIRLFFKKRTDYYLLGTPEYGNLGDHAIAMAEIQFINDCKKTVTEISSPNVFYDINGIKKIIRKKTILITGGGFLGSLWMNEENMVRKIMQTFPENKIIIFPQTIYYEKSKEAQKEKNITFKLYKEHKNLHIFAREENTYNFLKEELKGIDIKLVPDIVLYMNKTEKYKRENNILVCMRKDKEKVTSVNIEEFLKNQEQNVIYTDTVVPYAVKEANREYELNKKIKEFQLSKLVITNRLHGMIFAAITSTPCICIDNLTKKVSGVHKWINNEKYIKMINQETTLEEIEKFKRNVFENTYVYNEKEILEKFKYLREEIEG